MNEYQDTSMEEMASELIVGACKNCQMLPISCDLLCDREHLGQTSYGMFCGSAVEFYIRPLNSCIADVDELVFGNYEMAFVEDFPELPSDVSGLSDSIKCYKIEPHLTYPGFVRLRNFGEVNYDWKYKTFQFNRRPYPNSYSMVNMAAAAAIADREVRMANTTSGPAIKLYLLSGLEALDAVGSVWCPQWPKEAKGWPKRHRFNGCPTIDTISEAVRNGCHVVYARHRACRDDEYQWRLSFSVPEVILLQSWTKIQQIVYHLLRYFAMKELIQKNCPKEDEVLCTYHFKTLMLWTCEEMPPEWWNSSSVITICCELLQKLSGWLKKGYCPNYFIPEANLFHDPSSSTMFDKTQRKLNEFSDSRILSNWFVENYIHQFTQFKAIYLPRYKDYLQPLFKFWSKCEPIFLNIFFTYVFLDADASSRRAINTEGFRGNFDVRSLYMLMKFRLFTLKRTCAPTMSENVWWFTYLGSALLCWYAAYGIGFGNISWDSEVFVTLVKELSLKPHMHAVRCQYHRYPELTTPGRRFQFLRAQNILEQLRGFDSRSQFQLVSLLSKAFLNKALRSDSLCNDSQSDSIVPATLVYLAALHFAASEYQTVVELCSPVLQNPPMFFQSETLNASCLLFVDDVIRIVAFCLLSRNFSERNIFQFSKRQILLDLRLTPKVFAYYLTEMCTERMSKQSELNPNLITPSFPLDQFFAVLTWRKFCIPRKFSRPTSLIPARQCVYRRTDPVMKNATFIVNYARIEKNITDALSEYALENLISFYSVMGIKCATASCYRALYLYNCRQHDEVLHLCEEILHQPDLQNDLKQYAYTNVLLLPPLDTLFDGDVQCLLGLHTLFYYLSPNNEDLRKFEVTRKSTFAHFFSYSVYFHKSPLSMSMFYSYPVKCQYALGGHFVARYLKLRCLIDYYEQPWTEATSAFSATKRNHPFEDIIHRFVLHKLGRNRSNPGFSS